MLRVTHDYRLGDHVSNAATMDVDPGRPIPPDAQPARIAALVEAVRRRTDVVPEVGIVLGSGLGGLADELEDGVSIPFGELPGWPAATAPGHVGRLLVGRLGGRPVVMLQGASTSMRATTRASWSSRCCCSRRWARGSSC